MNPHSADTVVVIFPITFPATGPVTDLVGAVVIATAYLVGGGSVVAATHEIAGNTVTATFATGALAVGAHRIQLKVTKAGVSRVVADQTVVVFPSN